MTTVIKFGESGPILRRLSTVDLADHLAEADTVVAAARTRAAKLIDRAERDAKRLFEEAKRTGYDEGFSAGRLEGDTAGRKQALIEAKQRFDDEHGQLARVLCEAAEELHRIKADIRIAAERDVLELAVQIASKLTYAIGRLDRAAAQENLRRALDLVASKTDITVRIHPDDYDSVLTFAPACVSDAPDTESVQLVRDESIDPGGCSVQTNHTTIDATLKTQIEQVETLLLKGYSTNG